MRWRAQGDEFLDPDRVAGILEAISEDLRVNGINGLRIESGAATFEKTCRATHHQQGSSKMPEYTVGFTDGNERYLAFGTDGAQLPVYKVSGPIWNPHALSKMGMTYPSCFRFIDATVLIEFSEKPDGYIAETYNPIRRREPVLGT